MSHRHLYWDTDRREKSVQELLADLIWQGAVQVYFLKVIAEGISAMATPDQIANLTAAVEGLEAAEDAEKAQLDALLEELRSHQGDQPDPVLDALIARVVAATSKVEGFVPDDAPADPAPEPAPDA